MRIIIDIGHPAHVHYFRHFILIMEKRGHVIFVSARNRSIIHYLLNKYSIKYFNRGKGSNGMVGKFFYLLLADFRLLLKSIHFQPDLFLSFGTPYAAHVSWLLKKPHIALTDTEHAKYGIISISKFTSTFLTPSSYYKDLGEKQISFNGFMELCYLHPKRFTPCKDIYSLLGILEKDKYVLIRFVSWNANHDLGHSGLDSKTKRELIKKLESNGYRVFISNESNVNDPFFDKYIIKIPPERIHDVIAFATMYIGEGATMASECVMLGVPAIYVNSLDAGTLQKQEEYNLLFSFRNTKGVISKVDELLNTPNLKETFQNYRQQMLRDKIDLTSFLVWFIEEYPKSISIMKTDPNYQNNFK